MLRRTFFVDNVQYAETSITDPALAALSKEARARYVVKEGAKLEFERPGERIG